MDVERIVGLDLSLTATGYYVFDTPPKMDGGLLETGKLDGLARMDSILSQVDSLVDPLTLAVIEDFSFASKGRAVFQIGGLGFLVRHRLWKQGIRTLFVAPTLVKKFVTGAGNSEKSMMLKEVYKRWGADFQDDNVADAYALARIGRAYLGWEDKPLTSFQKEVLDKLRSMEK